MSLGSNVVYHADKKHHTVTETVDTEKNKKEFEGSVHHRELRDFAGLVTRENGEGKNATFDLVIFPPNAAPAHIAGVSEGDDDGEFEFV